MTNNAGIGPSYIWEPQLIRDTGLDGFFWALLLLIAGSGIAAAMALRRLVSVAGKMEVSQPG